MSSEPDPRDPSGFLKLDAVGRPAHSSGGEMPTVVKITGTARDDLNGLLGFCVSYNRDRERYMVAMANVDSANAPNATVMALKPQNLQKGSTIESYKAQLQKVRTDPIVRQRVFEYFEYARTKCRPFELEHVAGVAALLLGLALYFFGFTRTIMLVSAVVLVLLILVEDVFRSRKPWREVVRNFPSRSKFVIEKQFPFLRGKLSEPVAAGIIGLLLAFTIQSVFFPPSRGAAAASGAQSFPGETPSFHGSSPLRHKESLQQFYELGFKDAADGNDRGHSLAPALEELARAVSAASTMEDLDPIPDPIPGVRYDDQLEEPPPRRTFASRVFDLRTAGSVFLLYRTAMETGVDPSTGIFSVAQMAANIQHSMPTWKKAMIAFSCYNLIRNLFF